MVSRNSGTGERIFSFAEKRRGCEDDRAPRERGANGERKRERERERERVAATNETSFPCF